MIPFGVAHKAVFKGEGGIRGKIGFDLPRENTPRSVGVITHGKDVFARRFASVAVEVARHGGVEMVARVVAVSHLTLQTYVIEFKGGMTFGVARQHSLIDVLAVLAV